MDMDVTTVKLVELSMMIVFVYRSPFKNVDTIVDNLDKFLIWLSNFNILNILGGDFNFHLNLDDIEFTCLTLPLRAMDCLWQTVLLHVATNSWIPLQLCLAPGSV